MKFKVDTHTHTLASGHAYSTIREMAEMALEHGTVGSELNVITDEVI